MAYLCIVGGILTHSIVAVSMIHKHSTMAAQGLLDTQTLTHDKRKQKEKQKRKRQ